MSRNFISYSLFEPKKLYKHRTYDADKEKMERYWYNLPAVALINSVLYPEYEMCLSVCPETLKNPLFDFYIKLSNSSDKYSYRVVEENYTAHEPALWRMSLLWNQQSHIVLSRDIDSVPNIHEYQSTKVFEQSNYAVHTIRSHPHHYNYPCRMLIGLSGFKPAMIPSSILTSRFEEFKTKHSPSPELLNDPTVKWNSDQLTVINAFTNDEFFTSQRFLDTRIDNQKNYPDFYCNSIGPTDLSNIKITRQQRSIFSLVNKTGVTKWAGQPCDCRGFFLKCLTEIVPNSTVSEILEGNSDLKEFYLN
jgi:hypothetical protein